jgi:UDP-glucose 4-epimerase
MRVLISGGAGFIGSHVVDDFSAGHQRNLPSNVPVFEVDVCDSNRLQTVFNEVRPDWVCHLAAQMSVTHSMKEPVFDAKVNVIGLLEVLSNSARCGVKRIVFASSGGVIYGDVSMPASEDSPACPISPYGISKWVGEQYTQFFAREHGLQAVALRYANVYGPRQNPDGEAGVVAIFSKQLLLTGIATINGDGKYVRDYVYITDVARATVLALESELQSQFVVMNVGTGQGADVNELEALIRAEVQLIWNSAGRTGMVSKSQYCKARIGDLRSSLICADRARQALGWKPEVTLPDGLSRTVKWFASNNRLE